MPSFCKWLVFAFCIALAIIDEDQGLLEYLQRIILESSIRVQTQAADNDQQQKNKRKDRKRSYENDMPERVHEIWHRFHTRTSIGHPKIDIREQVVRRICVQLAPTRAVEEHLQPIELVGQWIAVIVPGSAILHIDGQVFIVGIVVDNPHWF